MSHLLVRLKAPDKILLVLETFERRRDIPPLVEFNANMQPALRNGEANTQTSIHTGAPVGKYYQK